MGTHALGTRLVKRILDLAWYLLWGLGVVGAVLIVVGMVRPRRVHITMPAFVRLDSLKSDVASAPHGGQLVVFHRLSGNVTVAGSRPALAFVFAVLVVGFGLIGFVLFQLRRLLGGAVVGRPFAVDSAQRVRVIGLAVVAAELLHAVVVYAASWWAHDYLQADGVSFR